MVLFELFTGRLPFDPLPEKDGGNATDYLCALAEQRRGEVPSMTRWVDVPATLDRVVRRCLAAEPGDPFPERRRVGLGPRWLSRTGPGGARAAPGGVVTAYTLRYPFLMAIVLMLLPQVLGSVVNIWYNSLRIVDRLTPEQQSVFPRIVLLYNVLIYPLCVGLLFREVLAVFRAWRRLSGPGPMTGTEVEEARRRALRLPLWVIGMSCLGWLPGGLVFPLALGVLAEPNGAEVLGHFLVSFTISGLIALTYSVFAVQFVVLRVLYPRLWLGTSSPRQVARGEVGWVEGRLRLLQFLAVLIPLAGAAAAAGRGGRRS